MRITWTRGRAPIVVSALVVAVASLSGCGTALPEFPDTVVDELHIAASCLLLPGGALPGVEPGVTAVLREGDDGPTVGGLDVALNGRALTFSQSTQVYSGPQPAARPGEDLALRIADDEAAVMKIEGAPKLSFDLRLAGGYWDTSSADAMNQLIWTNSTWGCEAVVVYVYDYEPSSGSSTLVFSKRLADDAMSVSIRNDELAYYVTMTTVTCLVCPTNGLPPAAHPDVSHFAVATGVGGNWQCVSGP
jgi:hypothetical protein